MITIIGAGMAGLLAARMLQHHDPLVIEKQTELPNNHSAVLRFKTSTVGDVLNIPFRKVSMIKATLPWRNPVADALAYSFKNTKTFRSDRSSKEPITVADRFIAPYDLIKRMAERVEIEFDMQVDVEALKEAETVVSTIPMPDLMSILEYPTRVPFYYISSWNITTQVDCCDAYVSLTIPNPDVPFSRVTLTGDELIVECYRDEEPSTSLIFDAATLLGIEKYLVHDIYIHRQHYSKITPIDESTRKHFIWWATDQHNIYSLGRYATWRPGLLLDDLVQDIRLIDKWLSQKSRYELAQHRR